MTGDLNAASGNTCHEGYPWDEGDSDSYLAYKFGVTSGTGYLVSLQANYDNHVEVMEASSLGEQLIGLADGYQENVSSIPFVANATTTYALRVGQDDPMTEGGVSDSGAYTLRVQTCKVPLAGITDSVTHVDSLTTGDCLQERSWAFYNNDSSYIHIYTMHFANIGGQRTIAITAGVDQELVARAGGPGYDPYCYFSECLLSTGDFTNGSWVVTAPDSGTYTLVIGTYGFSATTTPYTLTVGAEQAVGAHVTPPPMGGRSAAARAVAKGKPSFMRGKH